MSPGARVAAAIACMQATGLRLCGIALEPPTPFFGADSSISPTSGCAMSATSRAILPTAPTRMASADAKDSIASR